MEPVNSRNLSAPEELPERSDPTERELKHALVVLTIHKFHG